MTQSLVAARIEGEEEDGDVLQLLHGHLWLAAQV